MTRIIIAPFARRRNRLSSVWIQTGNPSQPLACVWIDRDLRMADLQGSHKPGVHLQCA